MRRFKRAWPILAFFLVSSLLAGGIEAQQDEVLDAELYPVLANSKPFQRWQWAYQQRAYPLESIPDGALQRAHGQISLLKELDALTAQQVETWTSIGPGPIVGGFLPWSGRVAEVAVDPSDSNHWLIGAAQGGIWETRDAGATWSSRTDAMPSLAMGAIAFAPSDPTIVYAGTGEATFSAASFIGAGILKSTDGGTNWTALNPAPFAKTTFSAIEVHPANPEVVLAATSRGTSGRGGGSPFSPPQTGILKSTDGGANWSVRLAGRATDLEVHPANFTNQYAALGEAFGSSVNGVYRSTDAGDTWARLNGPFNQATGGVGRIEIAIARSNPNIAYVSVQDAFGSAGDDGSLAGVWRTENAWDPSPSWTELPRDSSFTVEKQWWYDHDITVDPADARVLYLGGVSLRRFDGSNWSNVTGSMHVDQQSLAWAGNRLVVGNDGGAWSSSDGSNWTSHNTNLVITQFYDGSVHPLNPEFVIGGSQDNGTEKWTGSAAWQRVFGADGADNAIAFTRPDENWIISFQRLGIMRTTNGGNSFASADSGIDKTGALFIARIEKSPTNDDLVLVGTDNLWKCADFFSSAQPSWSVNGPEMRSDSGSSASISAIAFAPSDVSSNTYAFATSIGHLLLTTNGGTTWTDLDPANTVPNRYITDLAFDANDRNLLYVALSGYDEGTPGQPGHLFKTTNALAPAPSWSNVSPPANIPHNTVVLDAFAEGTVYVGTDLGVFKSADAGNSWTHQGPESGMPNVSVFDLQINHVTGQLVAFTHGRGAFINSSIRRVAPPPVISSAVLEAGGQPVESAQAGQRGLRITVAGTRFDTDTEVSINGVRVVSRAVDSRRRVIELDDNPVVRDSVGPLYVRVRNLDPISESSNVMSAGRLSGPELASIKVRPKAAGFDLKIAGSGFVEQSTVSVLDPNGRQIPVRVVAFIGSGNLKAKIRDELPAAGTQLRVRVISPTGIRSNEMIVTAP